MGDKVTPLLASRIDKAIEFYNSQKEKWVKPPIYENILQLYI